MQPIKAKQILAGLHWRYATKRFQPTRKIAARTWQQLEEAVVLAPSSNNLRPYEVIVVPRSPLRPKLLEASFGQPQIASADRLVVFAIKTAFGAAEVDAMVSRTAEVRGLPITAFEGLRSMAMGNVVRGMDDVARRNWATNQAYLALGTLLTTAALLGVDACPMEGFERCRYDDILKLPERGLGTVVIAALGHRSLHDKYASYPKVRFPREQVIRHV